MCETLSGTTQNVPNYWRKRNSRQCVLHSGCGFAAHAGQHVGVGVQGDGDGGVEGFLNQNWLCNSSEEQPGAGVPEVVETGVREPCTLQERLERRVPDTRNRTTECLLRL
jgi:hypothetical protein